MQNVHACFNSHDLPGRDPVLGAFRPRAPDFNSRDRTDRDSFLACIWAAISHFNSRDHTGRDFLPCYQKLLSFQFTRPHGPRLPTTCMPGASTKFQFTRPIRAAMQSAGHWITTSIFQFTRPIRAAILDVIDISFCHTFQFTRPIRAAMGVIAVIDLLAKISIHATHTGRDIDRLMDDCIRQNFNHATHTGRNSARLAIVLSFSSFQFTRPIRAAIVSD